MVRKVKLTRSEVELAKHFNVPLEDVAKAKLPKRGRPVGSKNKPKIQTLEVKVNESKKKAKSFSEEVASWEAEPRTPAVDWKGLAEKLQNALAKSYVDADESKKKIEKANMWLNIKQERINQLEDLLAQAVLAGDIDLEDDK